MFKQQPLFNFRLSSFMMCILLHRIKPLCGKQQQRRRRWREGPGVQNEFKINQKESERLNRTPCKTQLLNRISSNIFLPLAVFASRYDADDKCKYRDTNEAIWSILIQLVCFNSVSWSNYGSMSANTRTVNKSDYTAYWDLKCFVYLNREEEKEEKTTTTNQAHTDKAKVITKWWGTWNYCENRSCKKKRYYISTVSFA